MTQVQDKKSIKAKSFAISALMKNPKMSKILSDSWDAPAGSSKNTVAKSLLKSVYKSRQGLSYADGQGGLGDWFNQNIVSPMQGLAGRLKENISAAPEVAKPNIYKFVKTVDQYINPAPVTNVPGMSRAEEDVRNVASGLSSEFIRPLGQAVGNVSRAGASIVAGAATAPGITALNAMEGLKAYVDPQRRNPQYIDPFMYAKVIYPWGYEESKTPTAGKAPGTSPVKTGDSSKQYIRYKNSDKVYDKQTNKHITADEASKIDGFWSKVEEVDPPNRIGFVQGMNIDLDTGQPVFGDFAKTKTEEKQTGITQGDETVEDASGVFDSTSMSSEDFNKMESGLYGTSGEGTDLYSTVKGYADLGLGAETTAMMLMKDKKKLASMLGMDEAALKVLPEGTLAGHLNDLRSTIEKEYSLDTQLNKLNGMITQGASIDTDFKSYIRGRDEYLGTVDKLIDDTESKLAKMDTSNPYVAQRAQNYVNYLTILKGRQTQRYTDFLKTGVDEFQKNVDQATNVYNSSLNAAERKYKEMAAISTETYTEIKRVIKDLYANIESRQDKQLKLEEFGWKRAQAQRDAVLDTLKAAEIQQKLEGGGVTENLSEADMKVLQGLYGHKDENDNFVLDEYDPFEVMKSAKTTGAGRSQAAFTAWLQSVGSTVNGAAKGGTFNATLNKLKSSLSNMKNRLQEVKQLSQEEVDALSEDKKAEYESAVANNAQVADYWNKTYEKVRVNLKYGLQDYFDRSAERITDLRNAINDLSKSEGGWLGWGKTDKKGFINKYSEKLGKDISGNIWDYTMSAVNLQQETERANGDKVTPSGDIIKNYYAGITDEALPEILSSELSDYLMY